MKKLLPLLLSLAVAACSNETVSQTNPLPVADNYYTVCQHINGGMQTGDDGAYELMRHTDGSADIIFTDVNNGTRKALKNDTTVNIPHDVVTGIFVTDGYLYHYSHGSPLAMREADDTSVLYQYNTDGILIQSAETGSDIELDMDSAVVSDGEWLYISGSEIIWENGIAAESSDHIYAINQQTLEIRKIYTPLQAGISIIAGYKDSLVIDLKPFTVKHDGTKSFKNILCMLNMKNFEISQISQTRYPWYYCREGKLYNPYSKPGFIEIYNIDSKTAETVDLGFSEEKLKYGSVSVNFIADNHAFITTDSYFGNITENYIYDFRTEQLSPSPAFCGLPFVYLSRQDCYIAPVGYDKIPVAGGFYTVYDNNYAAVSASDYYSSTENLLYIKNEIDYR